MKVLENRMVAVVIVLVAVLTYPIVVLASGAPSFPSVHDCNRPATHDGEIQLVFGRFTRAAAANALAARAKSVGFVEAEATIDECGRDVVAAQGYTDLAGARSAVQEARSAGLTATAELAP